MNLVPWKRKEREDEGMVQSSDLARWSPFEDFRTEMERLFGQFLPGGGNWESPLLSSTWAPALDVTEDDKEVTIRTELPGMDPKDIDVSVAGQRLTISGHKQEEHQKKATGYCRAERRSGSFRRGVQLPSYVKAEKAEAAYKNGVLTIHLPKDESARAKRVSVRSES